MDQQSNGITNDLLSTEEPVVNLTNNIEEETGFFRGDLNAISPQPEERAPEEATFPTFTDNIAVIPEQSARMSEESSAFSPSSLRRESAEVATVEDKSALHRLAGKLEAVDALLLKALEIQRKLALLDDPETTISVEEKVEKLKSQKRRLEEEKLELEKLDNWKAGCCRALPAQPPVHDVKLAQAVDKFFEERRTSAPGITANMQPKQDGGIGETIINLRGNVQDITRRRSELALMAQTLRSQEDAAGTAAEKQRLQSIRALHEMRVKELAATIEQARMTINSYENMLSYRHLPTEKEPAHFERESEEDDDDDEPVDPKQLQAMRERLNRLRSKIDFSEAECQAVEEQNAQNATFDDLAAAFSGATIAPPKKPSSAPSSDLNNAPSSDRKPGCYSLADCAFLQRGSPPSKRRDIAPVEIHRQEVEYGSGDAQSGPRFFREEYPYMPIDGHSSESNDDDDDYPSFENQIRNLTNATSPVKVVPPAHLVVDHRNDLNCSSKKKANARNWKNGGRRDPQSGRVCGDQEHRLCGTGNRPGWRRGGGEDVQYATNQPAEAEPADFVRSLELMMVEQRKLLDTCGQYIAKLNQNQRGTPDQQQPSRRDRSYGMTRDIPIINNSALFHGECGPPRGCEMLHNEFDRSGNMLNNQRMEYAYPDQRSVERAQTRDTRRTPSVCHRDMRCGPEFSEEFYAKLSSHVSMTSSLEQLFDLFEKDMSSLQFILDTLLTLDSAELRRAAAARIGLIVANEKKKLSKYTVLNARQTSDRRSFMEQVARPSQQQPSAFTPGTFQYPDLAAAGFQSARRPAVAQTYTKEAAPRFSFSPFNQPSMYAENINSQRTFSFFDEPTGHTAPSISSSRNPYIRQALADVDRYPVSEAPEENFMDFRSPGGSYYNYPGSAGMATTAAQPLLPEMFGRESGSSVGNSHRNVNPDAAPKLAARNGDFSFAEWIQEQNSGKDTGKCRVQPRKRSSGGVSGIPAVAAKTSIAVAVLGSAGTSRQLSSGSRKIGAGSFAAVVNLDERLPIVNKQEDSLVRSRQQIMARLSGESSLPSRKSQYEKELEALRKRFAGVDFDQSSNPPRQQFFMPSVEQMQPDGGGVDAALPGADKVDEAEYSNGSSHSYDLVEDLKEIDETQREEHRADV